MSSFAAITAVNDETVGPRGVRTWAPSSHHDRAARNIENNSCDPAGVVGG
jgi:hypothetical protein